MYTFYPGIPLPPLFFLLYSFFFLENNYQSLENVYQLFERRFWGIFLKKYFREVCTRGAFIFILDFFFFFWIFVFFRDNERHIMYNITFEQSGVGWFVYFILLFFDRVVVPTISPPQHSDFSFSFFFFL